MHRKSNLIIGLFISLIFRLASIESLGADFKKVDQCLGKISPQQGIALGDAKDASDFCYYTYRKYPYTISHSNLAAKIINPSQFDAIKNSKTLRGYTLSNAIQAGVENIKLKVGLVAGDEDFYYAFDYLLAPIMKEIHDYDITLNKIQKFDLDVNKLVITKDLEEKLKKYNLSTRIRVARNISGFAMPSGATSDDLKKVSEIVIRSITNLSNEFKGGEYYTLQSLISNHKKMDAVRKWMFQVPPVGIFFESGAARYWPNFRGIYVNKKNRLAVWLNEEDHLRIISMQQEGSIKSLINDYANFYTALNKNIQNLGASYMFKDNIGFLTSCPSNAGTSMRMSFWLNLPNLSEKNNIATMMRVAKKYHLDIRPKTGEHTQQNQSTVWDVSNKRRLGLTEIELIQELLDGIYEMITKEESIGDMELS